MRDADCLVELQAFLISTDAAASLMMKVKLLSAKAVSHRQHQAGFHFLGLRVERLAELHDIEARWPNAGPIGGLGLAFPRGTCSLIKPTTFFATILSIGSCRTVKGEG